MFASLIGSIAIACAVAFGGAVPNAKQKQINFVGETTSVEGAYYDPNGEYGTEVNTIYNYSSCDLKFKYGYNSADPQYLDVGSGESVTFGFSGSQAFFLSVDGETHYLRAYANGSVLTGYGKDTEIIAKADYGTGGTNGDGYLPVSDLSGKYVWFFDAEVIHNVVSCEYSCLTSSAWDNNFQNSKTIVQFLGGNYSSHSSFVVVLDQTDFSAFSLYTDFNFTTSTYSYGNYGVSVLLDYSGVDAGNYSVSVVPFNPGSGVEYVGDIAQDITGGIVPIAQGLGSGFQDLMRNIFVVGHVDATTNEWVADGLSTFGIITICFAGLALALGLSRWIVNFVGSLGARDR